MNLSESYINRLQELAGIISEDLNFISKQDAVEKSMFGPVYHGTSKENMEKIQSNGFKVFVGSERSGEVSHGYEEVDYYNGDLPPIHHLGYGIYFTTVKAIATQFNQGTAKGIKEYYLDVSRLETINFGSPKNMMRWWINNGYDADLAETDRVAATIGLTKTLKSKYDAVWFKGKGIKRLLDGDQIVVFDPKRIYQLDPSLSKDMDIGAKVVSTIDFGQVPKDTIGIINGKRDATQIRDYWNKNNPPNTPHWSKDSKYIYDVSFKKGGRQYNVLDDMIKPYRK